MKKIRALHSWIEHLPPDIREAVLARMRRRHYCDGEAVYRLGEEGHELYMVESGKVRSSNYTLKGKEIQYTVLQAGDCFGELSLIDGLCRVHSTYAQGPADLLVLHKRDFDDLYARYSEIPIQINKLLSCRLRIAHTSVDEATVLSMQDRLARLLGRLGYSVGVEDKHGAIVLEGFTHAHLARMLGSNREGISRELKKLEEAGLLRRSYGKILIPDIRSLIGSCDGLVGGEPIVPDYHH
ncbi:catabolite gene activator [Marinobacterium nitratireducens]|uniref:Catabolite gene activator n=1 Tax=Marinobacterium nitratireducens TaxID=518897 RepID=A0A917ZRK8_9GAMM|nr:Crp/Fnr family transcriptional regulator [Marinobacterium nitratireducens]GGO88895.1 catabolite gene activator [Marinobacterium nitratireducens]